MQQSLLAGERESQRERERKIEPERESRGPQSLHILGQTPLFRKNISTISPTASYHIFNCKNESALMEPPFFLPPIKRWLFSTLIFWLLKPIFAMLGEHHVCALFCAFTRCLVACSTWHARLSFYSCICVCFGFLGLEAGWHNLVPYFEAITFWVSFFRRSALLFQHASNGHSGGIGVDDVIHSIYIDSHGLSSALWNYLSKCGTFILYHAPLLVHNHSIYKICY